MELLLYKKDKRSTLNDVMTSKVDLQTMFLGFDYNCGSHTSGLEQQLS